MNVEFSTQFVQIVDNISTSLPEPFTQSRMTSYDGRIAALSASFTLTQEKKLLGIMPTGSSTHCHETRMIYAAPNMDEISLTDWWEFLCRQQDVLVNPDCDHEFSIISLILVCDIVPQTVVKKLKKLSRQLQYHGADQAGWSCARCALIDLSNGKVYASKGAETLRDLLKPLL